LGACGLWIASLQSTEHRTWRDVRCILCTTRINKWHGGWESKSSRNSSTACQAALYRHCIEVLTRAAASPALVLRLSQRGSACSAACTCVGLACCKCCRRAPNLSQHKASSAACWAPAACSRVAACQRSGAFRCCYACRG
jgi:hypothetical protein